VPASRPPIVLASGSPQRKALLERLGVPFTVRATDAEEIEQGEDPAQVAVENALRKARAASLAGDGRPELVIGCDTIVVLDGVIYGKPPDVDAARRTLSALGGRTHEVISGLAVLAPGQAAADVPGRPAGPGGRAALVERTAVERTRVSFRAIDSELLDWYVATEEWRGRSGGYAIQGAGSKLALAVEGEEENVVGLPVRALLALCPELLG
jgi:septum formation protein